jgi:hypothetical protein
MQVVIVAAVVVVVIVVALSLMGPGIGNIFSNTTAAWAEMAVSATMPRHQR